VALAELRDLARNPGHPPEHSSPRAGDSHRAGARHAMTPLIMRATHPNPATEVDVNRLLGDVDPLIIERVLAIGASADEIDEALQDVQDEDGFGERFHEPSSTRVASVRALLEDTLFPEPDRDEEGFEGY
jgi:hypothetical protein